MKCPKCLYIGFETGDRCKNCGYDFSLLGMAEDAPVSAHPELELRRGEPAVAGLALDLSPAHGGWSGPDLDRFRDVPDLEGPAMTFASPADLGEGEEPTADVPVRAPAAASAASEVPALPLFAPDAADDEPLVRLPATPRPPLAVRRTPETPRLRPMSTIERTAPNDAVLEFVEEPGDEDVDEEVAPDDFDSPSAHVPFEAPISTMGRPAFRADPAADTSPFGRRVAAAIIDHGILLGIDLAVLYFTLRLTDLTFADWRVVPWLPLAAFLLSVKVAYLSAFTTAGGQTIGKMATHIRVVSEDGGGLDAGRSLRRAVLELVSIATAGAPFLTAIADPMRRGVHDRASGTRVVALSR